MQLGTISDKLARRHDNPFTSKLGAAPWNWSKFLPFHLLSYYLCDITAWLFVITLTLTCDLSCKPWYINCKNVWCGQIGVRIVLEISAKFMFVRNSKLYDHQNLWDTVGIEMREVGVVCVCVWGWGGGGVGWGGWGGGGWGGGGGVVVLE